MRHMNTATPTMSTKSSHPGLDFTVGAKVGAVVSVVVMIWCTVIELDEELKSKLSSLEVL